jgi:hypothetical protein
MIHRTQTVGRRFEAEDRIHPGHEFPIRGLAINKVITAVIEDLLKHAVIVLNLLTEKDKTRVSIFFPSANVLAEMKAFLAAVIEVDDDQIRMQFMENLSCLFTACGADDMIYAIE